MATKRKTAPRRRRKKNPEWIKTDGVLLTQIGAGIYEVFKKVKDPRHLSPWGEPGMQYLGYTTREGSAWKVMDAKGNTSVGYPTRAAGIKALKKAARPKRKRSTAKRKKNPVGNAATAYEPPWARMRKVKGGYTVYGRDKKNTAVHIRCKTKKKAEEAVAAIRQGLSAATASKKLGTVVGTERKRNPRRRKGVVRSFKDASGKTVLLGEKVIVLARRVPKGAPVVVPYSGRVVATVLEIDPSGMVRVKPSLRAAQWVARERLVSVESRFAQNPTKRNPRRRKKNSSAYAKKIDAAVAYARKVWNLEIARAKREKRAPDQGRIYSLVEKRYPTFDVPLLRSIAFDTQPGRKRNAPAKYDLPWAKIRKVKGGYTAYGVDKDGTKVSLTAKGKGAKDKANAFVGAIMRGVSSKSAAAALGKVTRVKRRKNPTQEQEHAEWWATVKGKRTVKSYPGGWAVVRFTTGGQPALGSGTARLPKRTRYAVLHNGAFVLSRADVEAAKDYVEWRLGMRPNPNKAKAKGVKAAEGFARTIRKWLKRPKPPVKGARRPKLNAKVTVTPYAEVVVTHTFPKAPGGPRTEEVTRYGPPSAVGAFGPGYGPTPGFEFATGLAYDYRPTLRAARKDWNDRAYAKAFPEENPPAKKKAKVTKAGLDKLNAIFERLIDKAEKRKPMVRVTKLYVQRGIHTTPRAFACTNGKAIYVAPELLGESQPVIRGVLAHELGHVLRNLEARKVRKSYDAEERAADKAAEAMLGLKIYYDKRGVETTTKVKGAKRPRPAGLR